jgi:DNA-binding transcriptional MerR regulator
MVDASQSEIEFFPIRVLSERTGVGASTLRAWERRYGLLKPRRTPKGHRLYTQEDVRLVEAVLELLGDGHAISDVARRVGRERLSGATERHDIGPSLPDGRGGQWRVYLADLLRAVEAFSPRRLDAIYNEASSLYPLDLVSRNLIEPALEVLGERWNARTTGIAEEHFFSAWLRNKLGARLHHASARTRGPRLVVACVPGHRHEMGVLLFMLAALGRGFRVIYLGIDMPLESLPEVVERCGASGVVLAGGREPDREATISALGKLANRLSCPLFVGGSLSLDYERALNRDGVIPIGEQFALALHLVETRVPPDRPTGRPASWKTD